MTVTVSEQDIRRKAGQEARAQTLTELVGAVDAALSAAGQVEGKGGRKITGTLRKARKQGRKLARAQAKVLRTTEKKLYA